MATEAILRPAHPVAADEMLDEWYGDDAVEAGVRPRRPPSPRHVRRLYRLYVHPDDWRSGIGRQSLAEVEQALYERDVSAYEVEVLADNDVATAFYESTGFERVDEGETELAGVSVSEYRYRKRL